MVKRKNYNWNKIRKEFQESDLTYSAFSTQKRVQMPLHLNSFFEFELTFYKWCWIIFLYF